MELKSHSNYLLFNCKIVTSGLLIMQFSDKIFKTCVVFYNLYSVAGVYQKFASELLVELPTLHPFLSPISLRALLLDYSPLYMEVFVTQNSK